MRKTSRSAILGATTVAIACIGSGTAIAAPAESSVAEPLGSRSAYPITETTETTTRGDHAAEPLDRVAEIDRAVTAVLGAYSSASGDGRLVGTGIGVIVGCPLGAVTGGTLTVLVSGGALTPIGIVGGCILGGLTLGGLGGSLGGAITGLPALATSASEQYTKLRSKGFVAE